MPPFVEVDTHKIAICDTYRDVVRRIVRYCVLLYSTWLRVRAVTIEEFVVLNFLIFWISSFFYFHFFPFVFPRKQ